MLSSYLLFKKKLYTTAYKIVYLNFISAVSTTSFMIILKIFENSVIPLPPTQ